MYPYTPVVTSFEGGARRYVKFGPKCLKLTSRNDAKMTMAAIQSFVLVLQVKSSGLRPSGEGQNRIPLAGGKRVRSEW